ncbi:hypothetical protein B0H10DRAFT_1947496 [Mycena sp. CBHHK59/15]|nr:hypothetical protein B0H10DRAFT_1947496 [Mycena sp. CBHHK59/15]
MEYNFAFEYPPTYQDSYGFNWPEVAQRRLEARELIECFELAFPWLNRTLKAAEQETFWLPYTRREIRSDVEMACGILDQILELVEDKDDGMRKGKAKPMDALKTS